MSLLSVHELSCERGGMPLFDQLDFSINPGELLQVLGPNGSGKSTLLRILAGLSSAYAGELLWNRLPVRTNSSVDNVSFLYMGHKTGIKSMLSPMENLRWYVASGSPDSRGSGISDDDILGALAQWQLSGYEHQPCYQLSAGQQQRVALARLYLTRAVLWLLDEPFTAIDQAGVAHLEMLLLAHAENGGAAVLTTHHIFRQSERLRFLPLQPVVVP